MPTVAETQAAYAIFRRQYKMLLRNARREMTTNLQKALVDTVAATAYSAGYNAKPANAKPVVLKGWKAKR